MLLNWSINTLTLKLSLTEQTRHLAPAVNSLVAVDGWRLVHIAAVEETGEKILVKFEPPDIAEAA